MTALKDRLSHLNYSQACRLLGPNGKKLIMDGGKYEIDPFEQVTIRKNLFRLDLGDATVSIRLGPGQKPRLKIECSHCEAPCTHKGAALSLILEEKLSLGLSAPPPEKIPVESMSDAELVEQAVAERAERAQKEKMRLKILKPDSLWTDYILTNSASGKSYRVALRGWERGESYCSCPDFRKNTLGTCKHIIYALNRVKWKFNKSVRETPAVITDICIYIKYGKDIELRMLVPEKIKPDERKLIKPFRNRRIRNVKRLIRLIRRFEQSGRRVIIYPDAEEYISRLLYRKRVKGKVDEIRKDPKNHHLRKTLLKSELLPYQLDGIAFAVGAGRAVLADDMGLGKTIQGIGVAELLAKDADISKVLVICPASLKSQWRIEIEKFSNRTSRVVLGKADERAAQYDDDRFFTICNYEQVLRDILSIEKVKWDLIILDEGQRIKNWETKTSRIIKALRSPFALVLSGTPLENRIDELFSVVEFIDDRRLGPAFRFYNQYRIVDEKGKPLGYKNLDELREKLKPVLLRRTRKTVMKDLPPRTTEIIRIPPTEEQLELHNSHKRVVQTIITKKYLTEMDLLRLQKALLMCRMCADSTFLVEKTGRGFSTKLKELENLLYRLNHEDDRKIILFSEWTTMLDLIEPILENQNMKYVRLDGSVPQKKRQDLMRRFQNDSECKLFITTNAGSTGLNLQAADTVINVDLPWNPAVLEQRIGRAHRMGQKRSVHVFLLVTEDTLEESLLGTLSAKHELSLAVLDPDSTVTHVDLSTGIEELKRRMEVLLGNKPEAPVDESMKEDVEKTSKALARKERMSVAGARMLDAAFTFIGEMFPQADGPETDELAEELKRKFAGSMEKDEEGRLKMTFLIPDESAVDRMAKSFAKIIRAGMK